jgi:hypothetical protein
MRAIRIVFFALIFALVSVGASFAAGEGSCVFTKSNYTAAGKFVVKRSWVCTSDGATGNIGSASAATITGTGYDETVYSGTIRIAEIIPGTGGDAPTAITTCLLVPTDDTTKTLDYLGGLGAAASNTNPTYAMPIDSKNGAPLEVMGRALTVVATGLGVSNKVTINIYSIR